MNLERLKPEKKVEKEIMSWCLSKGWDVAVFDSKAKWNPIAKRFLRSKDIPVGCCDILGCTNHGMGVFIELKARGVRSVRLEQYEYMKPKIERGAICGPIRSHEELEALFLMNPTQRLAWLMSFSIEYPKVKRKIKF